MSAPMRRNIHTPDLYHAALYLRLSRDDDGTDESASIATQRKMLRIYAQENAYTIADEYIDDGWSGTNFDRPEFKRMIADIESKKINMVITKDFSRLGRDYITAGQYTEIYFPEHQVRYIAVNDGYDSANPFNDIAPFKHVINEMYARDTSKKIRSTFKTKMQEGSYIGSFAPYGYKKDPDNKNHLIIDYEVAPIIKEIFQMAAGDYRPSDIAGSLNGRGIATPALYRSSKHPYLNADTYSTSKQWTSASICKILRNAVYLGHMAQGKTSKPSFKSKTAFRKPPEEWYVVENTHEALITQEVFDLAKNRSISRRSSPKTDFRNVFSGIAKCADCGRNMSTTGTRKKGATYNLVCGGYKLYGSKQCSNHFIDYDFLYQSVLSEVREMLTLSDTDQKLLIADMKKTSHSEKHNDSSNEAATLIAKLRNRDKELDALVQHLYEDNVSGKISNSRFAKLNVTYEAEQQEIVQKIEMLNKSIVQKPDIEDPNRHFFEAIGELTQLQELTSPLVKRLIERIDIAQGYYEKTPEGKKKHQTIRIFWRFTG